MKNGGVKTKDMIPGGHGCFFLTFGEKEETAEAHSSTSLLGLFVGGGNMWVLTKVGVLGDGGDLVRLFLGVLGGEIIPDPGPDAGYLVRLLSPSCGIPLNSASKLTRGDRGDRESGD